MPHADPRHALWRTAVAWVLACALLAGLAGAAHATSLHATVVHRNSRAQSFAVADARGRLFAIHAAHSPRVGSRVDVSTRPLPNGTLAVRSIRVLAHRSRAHVRVRGTVTFVDRRGASFVLSAPGVSMLVRSARGPARAADSLPTVGTEVTATGTLDDQGDLEEQSVQDDGTDTGPVDLEGTVLAVDPVARTLSVSADDSEESSAAVTVTVPAGMAFPSFVVGQEVELAALAQPDGSFVLRDASSDEGAQGADGPTGTEDGGVTSAAPDDGAPAGAPPSSAAPAADR